MLSSYTDVSLRLTVICIDCAYGTTAQQSLPIICIGVISKTKEERARWEEESLLPTVWKRRVISLLLKTPF